jgi:hypothetical protein
MVPQEGIHGSSPTGNRLSPYFAFRLKFLCTGLPASKAFVEIGARARLLLEGRNLNTGYGRTEGNKVIFMRSLRRRLSKHIFVNLLLFPCKREALWFDRRGLLIKPRLQPVGSLREKLLNKVIHQDMIFDTDILP